MRGALMECRWLILFAAALLSGCGAPSIKVKSGELTQSQADGIATRCGGDEGMLLVKDGELTLVQAKEFDVTSCIMKSLDSAGITDFASSVRNEKH